MPLVTQKRAARALGLCLALLGVVAGLGFAATAPRLAGDGTDGHRSAQPKPFVMSPSHPLPALSTDSGPRILGIEYGISDYPASMALSQPGSRTVVAFTWMFYLVLDGDRRILVDTGLVDRAAVARYGIRRYRPPDVLLGQLGYPPESITDVVLTHGDVDHAGGVVRYPMAIIHLQRATAKRIAQISELAEARRTLVRAETEGRLHWVGQSHQLTKDITIEHIGGHSQGSQVVLLSRGEQRYVFVGDECYLREACRAGQPLPARAVSSPSRNRAFLDRLAKRVPTGTDVLLPCHDPVVLHEHPALAPGVVQIR